MKRSNVFILFFFLLSVDGVAQSLDSLVAIPRSLELSISTPQPRLGQQFKVMLDENYLRAQIFKSAIGKIQLADNVGNTDEGQMVLTVNALVKGKDVIGPLEFTINGTKYTTNKIEYEVIDRLPDVDRGVWVRKVKLSDSTFDIIIEQRIPAKWKTNNSPEKNSTSFTQEAESTNILKFKDNYSIEGVRGLGSFTSSDYGSYTNDKGEQIEYLNAFSIYHFLMDGKTPKIVITKDKLENFPSGYNFESIEVTR